MEVIFNDTRCSIKKSHYFNYNVRLQLMDIDDGMPVATATVNTEQVLANNEVLIKDYSENEGLYQALIDSHVIHPGHRTIKTGHVDVQVCYLVNKVFNVKKGS